jgi:hypothetical protein
MISKEQKDFFFGRKKFKFTHNTNKYHLVVDFDGNWSDHYDNPGPYGTVIESDLGLWKVGQYKTWNEYPSFWEDIEIQYVPTQEGDKEDDI